MHAERRVDLVVLATVLALGATGSTFLDWGRSGQRARSGYEIVDVADRAGVLPDGWAWSASLLHLAPAACGVVLVAAALRRPSIAGWAAATLGLLVGTAALLVIRSPLVAEPAAWAAVVLGPATTSCGIAVLVTAQEETVG